MQGDLYIVKYVLLIVQVLKPPHYCEGINKAQTNEPADVKCGYTGTFPMINGY